METTIDVQKMVEHTASITIENLESMANMRISELYQNMKETILNVLEEGTIFTVKELQKGNYQWSVGSKPVVKKMIKPFVEQQNSTPWAVFLELLSARPKSGTLRDQDLKAAVLIKLMGDPIGFPDLEQKFESLESIKTSPYTAKPDAMIRSKQEVIIDSPLISSKKVALEAHRRLATSKMVGFDELLSNSDLITKMIADLNTIFKDIKIKYNSDATPLNRRDMKIRTKLAKDVVIVWILYLSGGSRIHKLAQNAGEFQTVCETAVSNIGLRRDANNRLNQATDITIGAFLGATIDVGNYVVHEFIKQRQQLSFMYPGGKKVTFRYQYHPLTYCLGGASMYFSACMQLKMEEDKILEPRNVEKFVDSVSDYTTEFINTLQLVTGRQYQTNQKIPIENAKRFTRVAATADHARKIPLLTVWNVADQDWDLSQL